MPVNSMDYSGKDTVLDVIRTERDKFYQLSRALMPLSLDMGIQRQVRSRLVESLA